MAVGEGFSVMGKVVDTVAFIVHEDGKILVERRRPDRRTDPGKIVIPGGHVEAGESLEEACMRELKEELYIDCEGFEYITTLLHRTDIEDQNTHYYFCEGWAGTPKSLEAEEIFWIGVDQLRLLDFEIDRRAAGEFFRKRTLS
jgi:8-oxo-dGTP diphosphatase